MRMSKRKVKFEEMIPSELQEAIEGVSIAYLPVGSMEWHGPHMGMGVDTVHAYAVALGTAQKLGGAVMPPLFIGTEKQRSEEVLQKIGFNGDEQIIGMDFPKNSIRSMYWPEDLFVKVVKQSVCFLLSLGFRTVAIINGHGADNQIAALEKIASEVSGETGSRVIPIFVLYEGCGVGIGHAGLAETSIMLALAPESVRMNELPPKPEKLRNIDYAIVDNESFITGSNHDFTVRHDPRDATAETGFEILDYAIEQCVKTLRNAANE